MEVAKKNGKRLENGTLTQAKKWVELPRNYIGS